MGKQVMTQQKIHKVVACQETPMFVKMFGVSLKNQEKKQLSPTPSSLPYLYTLTLTQ